MSGRLAAVFLAALSTIGLAACGSSGGHGGSRQPDFLALSRCMRAHGVTNFPDPSSGGGINLDGTGINPASPSFQAAQTTCFKLLPGGGPVHNPHPSAALKAQVLAIAQCMRAHGVTNFPDPTLTPPAPGQIRRYSMVEDRNGVVIALPSTIDIRSPAFLQAAKTCRFQ